MPAKWLRRARLSRLSINACIPYRKLIGAFPNIYKERKMVESIPGDLPDLTTSPAAASPRLPTIGDICFNDDPPLVDYDGSGHMVACHLRRAEMTDIRKPSPGQESPLLEVKNPKVEFSIRQSFTKSISSGRKDCPRRERH